ncbi:hypothetical protein BRD00_13875 [Halobacteriales archaeon QS_8_69_26]|nr:MAG: hypothetical protein BRD00_13875 [Halobacteriales archaeon QS_8_69_26]
MEELLYDSLGELLALAGTAALSAGLTVVGLVTEWAAFQNALAGQTSLGIRELAVGGLLLYVGLYLVGYGKLWPQVRDRQGS